MYKRQIYQIAESNRKKIDSVARMESKLFLPELECSSEQQRWRRSIDTSTKLWSALVGLQRSPAARLLIVSRHPCSSWWAVRPRGRVTVSARYRSQDVRRWRPCPGQARSGVRSVHAPVPPAHRPHCRRRRRDCGGPGLAVTTWRCLSRRAECRVVGSAVNTCEPLTTSAPHTALSVHTDTEDPFQVLVKRVCVQLPTSAVNVTLLAFADERRCSWTLGGRRCRSISPAFTALSSKPVARPL